MTTSLDAGDVQAARNVADLVKADNAKEVGNSLAQDYLAMGKDGARFGEFLKKIAADNAADQKTNNKLPGLDYGPDSQGDLRVNLTTPGRFWGNHWRDEEEVFADIKTTGQEFGSVGGIITTGNETAIADTGSNVDAYGNVNVIAEDRAYVNAHADAHVTAERGSVVTIGSGYSNSIGHVIAKDGSTVIASTNTQITAEAGSNVEGHDNAQITAEANSDVVAHDNAQVTAETDSRVVAHDNSQITAESKAVVGAYDKAHVLAKSGAFVINDGDPNVTAEAGATVITPFQFEQLKQILGK
jgi:hypothetical protein